MAAKLLLRFYKHVNVLHLHKLWATITRQESNRPQWQTRYARRFRKWIWKRNLNSPLIQQELTDSTERPNKNGNQTHNLYAVSHCCWAHAHLPSGPTLREFILSSAFFFVICGDVVKFCYFYVNVFINIPKLRHTVLLRALKVGLHVFIWPDEWWSYHG